MKTFAHILLATVILGLLAAIPLQAQRLGHMPPPRPVPHPYYPPHPAPHPYHPRPVPYPVPRPVPVPVPHPVPYPVPVPVPYAWHPYHPYYWGPTWHPVGWVAATLAATAIVVSITDAVSPKYPTYYYDNGVFYAPSGSSYIVVAPPVGVTIVNLPQGYTTVVVSGSSFYYYGGVFYAGSSGSYKVTKAPVGAVITQLPQGAQEVNKNGQKLMEYEGTYYQPIMQDGKDAYQVASI